MKVPSAGHPASQGRLFQAWNTSEYSFCMLCLCQGINLYCSHRFRKLQLRIDDVFAGTLFTS